MNNEQAFNDIQKKYNSGTFSKMIEELAHKLNTSYMDAIVYYCEENNVEVETAAILCNKSLKQKLRVEAEDLNFLPKSKRLF